MVQPLTSKVTILTDPTAIMGQKPAQLKACWSSDSEVEADARSDRQSEKPRDSDIREVTFVGHGARWQDFSL